MWRFGAASQCAIVNIMEQPMSSSALAPGKAASTVPNYGPLNRQYPQWRPGVGSRRRSMQEPDSLVVPWMYSHCSQVGLRRMAAPQRAVSWLFLLVGLAAAGLAGYGLSGMDEEALSSTIQAQALESIGLPASARHHEGPLAAVVPDTPDVSGQGALPFKAPSPSPAAEAQSGQDPARLAGRNGALQTSAGIASDATLSSARVATGSAAGVPAAVSIAPTFAATPETSTVLLLTSSRAGHSAGARRIRRLKPVTASAECNDALRSMQICDIRSSDRP